MALFGVAFAQSTQSGALSLANVAVMPNPVVAGGNATIVFQLYNSYGSSLTNVNLQLTGSYPLLNFSPTGSYIVSAVGSGLYAGAISYTMHVPKTTPTGTYTLSLVGTYQTVSSIYGQVVGSSVMPLSFYVNGIPNITAVAGSTPVTPGSSMVLYARVVNSGYDTAKNLVVRALNASGFTPYGVSTFSISSLPVGTAVNLSINYQTSQSVRNGTYTLPLAVSYQSGLGTPYAKVINLTESIAIVSPQVKLSFANPMPQALFAGYNQTVQLQIQNVGNGVAKNVSVSLAAGQGTNLLGSVDSFFVSTLQPGQTVSEPVLLSASGVGSATVNATVAYYSAGYSKSFTGTQLLGLALAPAAQFTVTGVRSSLSPGSTDIPVTFTVKNTGTVDAQGVQFNLQSTYPITPIASTYYMSDVPVGSSANVTFLVSADSQGVAGTYPVTLFEQWKQPNGAANQQFSGSNSYFVTVGAAGSSTTTIAEVIVVVAVVAGAYVFMKRRSAKAKPKTSAEKAKGK
jgi:hypothetical protein